jgi:hypothetical protein
VRSVCLGLTWLRESPRTARGLARTAWS